jgi:hypothetical protein
MQKTIHGGRLQLLIDIRASILGVHRQADTNKKHIPKHVVGKRHRSVQADKTADKKQENNRHGAEELLYRHINRGIGADRQID